MRRLGLLTAIVAGLVLGVAVPASADVTDQWQVVIHVEADGSFRVSERITQTFTTSRRGIFRYLPVTERIAPDGLVEVPDGTVDDFFQRILVEDIRVTTGSPATPGETEITRPSRHDPYGQVRIRIGEEDTYITGTHVYEISYRVVGAMLDGGDGTSLLRWDVIGDGWQQDIVQAEVTVEGAAVTGDALCATGAFVPATAACAARIDGGRFRAMAGQLMAGTPMSIQVAFDASDVAPSTPILQRRFTLTGALWGDGRALPLALLVLVLVFGWLLRLLYREGRDRETRGNVTVDGRTDVGDGNVAGNERTRPLLQPRPVPIALRPPDGLRPGELGLIVDERVDAIDIAATVVDLAVRGYLVIDEERTKKLWWTRTDWTLRSTELQPDDLHAYEKAIHKGLFDGRSEVTVSELKGTFAADHAKASKALYELGRQRRWFAARPDKVRAKWLGLGIAAFVVSLVLFGLAMYFTRMAVAVLPLVVGSMVMIVAHRWMPRRTPKGSDLLTQALGFRTFIETAETDRARFAEQQNLFVEYLPYAVVFGVTEKWAQAFADLAILTAGTGLGGWYLWHGGAGGFDARAFSSGLADFSTNMGTAAVTSPPSSSGGSGGGFSGGGGFGGGGGGSW